MIYLIGGPVRVGKSRLARMLLEREKISTISTDALTSSIGKIWPETELRGGVPQDEWEMNFYPFLRRFIEVVQADYDDYVIEGAVISPTMVHKLTKKFEVRGVFLGNSNISLEDLTQFMGNNTWLHKVNESDQVKIPERIIRRSKEIENDCFSFGFDYVDLSGDFDVQIEKAYHCLFRN